MELKIPGKIWKGSLFPTFNFIQKHLVQKSGSASSPRLFADIVILSFIYYLQGAITDLNWEASLIFIG